MREINLTHLKTRQDELNIRKNNLLSTFKEFVNGFIEFLDKFTSQAVDEGILSTSKLQLLPEADQVRMFNCTLNDMYITGVITDTVYGRTPTDNVLAAKIFLYLSEEDDAKPFIEIEVYEENNSFNYYAGWYSSEGKLPITLGNSATREDGQEAADATIGLFNRFSHSWLERPILSAYRGQGRQQHSKYPLGFQLPKS